MAIENTSLPDDLHRNLVFLEQLRTDGVPADCLASGRIYPVYDLPHGEIQMATEPTNISGYRVYLGFGDELVQSGNMTPNERVRAIAESPRAKDLVMNPRRLSAVLADSFKEVEGCGWVALQDYALQLAAYYTGLPSVFDQADVDYHRRELMALDPSERLLRATMAILSVGNGDYHAFATAVVGATDDSWLPCQLEDMDQFGLFAPGKSLIGPERLNQFDDSFFAHVLGQSMVEREPLAIAYHSEWQLMTALVAPSILGPWGNIAYRLNLMKWVRLDQVLHNVRRFFAWRESHEVVELVSRLIKVQENPAHRDLVLRWVQSRLEFNSDKQAQEAARQRRIDRMVRATTKGG